MSTIAQTTSIPSNIVFNDAYIAVNKLLALLGGDVPRYKVRKYLTELSGFPNTSLYGIIELLIRLDTTPKAKKTDLENISNEVLPAIGHISCNGQEGVYITLLQTNGTQLEYLGPDNLVKQEAISELSKKWSGFIINASFDETVTNVDELQSDADYIAEKEYLNAIHIQENFITDAECDEIIRLSEEKSVYERSLVELLNKSDTAEESALRTSYSAVLPNDPNNLVLQAVYAKAAKLADVFPHQMEALQCVRYASGQEYKTHFDGDNQNRRIKTILVYLNDDFQGGQTAFTEIGLIIKPQKGSALIFHNLDENNNPLIESAHCGMPVHAGVKYAMNIWIKDIQH